MKKQAKTQKKTQTKRIEKKDPVLSDKHKAFIDEYFLNGYNATRAYMKIYPKSNYESSRAQASLLLTNLNIKAEIAERFKKRAMGPDEVISRLSDMARATHYPFIEIDDEGFVYFDFSSEEAKSHLHLIKKIKSKRNRQITGKGDEAITWEGEWVEVELYDAKDALKLIGEYEQLFAKDKGEETFTAPQVVELIRTYERDRDE